MSSILLMSPRSAEAHARLEQALRADGHHLHFAQDIETAFTQARQAPPFALILETKLTGADDLSLCQWLRTNPATIATKLLVTAQSTPQRLAALEAGADELLVYPLDWVEVRTRLRTMLPGQARYTTLEDFLSFTPDLMMGANPADILGSADLIAHDLKNPVSIVVSTAEMLREFAGDRKNQGDNFAEQEIQLFENLVFAARRLLYLVSDMLDLAKLEVDGYPVQLEPISLDVVVQAVINRQVLAINQKGVQVTVEAPDNLPAARGDRDLIERVCNVLLDTSLKFSLAGDHIRWVLSAGNGMVTIKVIDNGRPILSAYQDAIFQRGIQWEARQQGSRTSIALGLPFAQIAVRRMGGSLRARSQTADKTTTFSLQLPLAT